MKYVSKTKVQLIAEVKVLRRRVVELEKPEAERSCVEKALPESEESYRALLNLGAKYLVLTATNGEEAVALAREESPDLILMDIMMPKMDGYTACHTIKRGPVTKSIPVIMFTGLGYALNVKLSESIGADDYITKPFLPNDLLCVVDRFLKKSKKINR